MILLSFRAKRRDVLAPSPPFSHVFSTQPGIRRQENLYRLGKDFNM
jgi:hypothetical protein